MRVLLVTSNNQLAEKLAALNPELEYCGIIVDEVEPAKEILEQVGLSDVPLYPMSELQTCVETLNYDYIFPVQDNNYGEKIMWELPKYNVEKSKIINFAHLHDMANFKTEQMLRYYKEHAQDFEMIATGISTAWAGLDVTRFKRKCFNFAIPSQDLYYDFKIAKFAISCVGGGNSKLRYALIGLTPYIFHFDLSKSVIFKDRILQYFIAFGDLHNFFLPTDVYKNFLSEEYLTKRLPTKSLDINVPYGDGTKIKMSITTPLVNNAGFNPWKVKQGYPETRDENIKILDDYLTLCDENNILPIMFRVPVTERLKEAFNKTLMKEFDILVEQTLQKHPDARFLDGWKWDGVTYDDFYDHAHLNIYGAAKFSAYMNDFIEGIDKQGGVN